MTHIGAITLVIVQKLLPDTDDIIWQLIHHPNECKEIIDTKNCCLIWILPLMISSFHYDDIRRYLFIFCSTDRISSFTVFITTWPWEDVSRISPIHNDLVNEHQTQSLGDNLSCRKPWDIVHCPFSNFEKDASRGIPANLQTKTISLQYQLYRHYNDVTMTTMASQITSLTVVCSTVYSDADQRKHQCSASLVFVWGIHQGPVNSPHKWLVWRKMLD